MKLGSMKLTLTSFLALAVWMFGTPQPVFASVDDDDKDKEEEEAEEEEEKEQILAVVGGDIYTGTGAMLRVSTVRQASGWGRTFARS